MIDKKFVLKGFKATYFQIHTMDQTFMYKSILQND